MMYPRLYLARNLLREDGVIFISIDENEVANLQLVCDEVFGEENMLCLFAWRSEGNFDNQAKFKYCHEYVLAYAKNERYFPHPLTVDPNVPKSSKIYRPEIRNTIVKNGPKNPPSKIVIPKGFPAAFDKGDFFSRNDSWPKIENDFSVANGEVLNEVAIYSGWSSKHLILEFIENGFEEVLDAKGQATTFEITSKEGLNNCRYSSTLT
ncbi:site-specific DNA-methyltransferase [Halomonas sp. ATBC28]|nr:site-specific DNA-methyltransferase [Halomonas sp. ATBC28]